ncbi:hypothetical protein HYDPIDRAFT_170166 [Hydnomerulius pinastri MD-312]|uniref:Uncharacterized protein n=1 Tax=Hydnomerulius pinastri MD-312 TaxID=994086 RepID=A0A0C9VRU5_9AGAM|nr:hypothetical protein HYDPIDRAFT_170166 [Hydnomerulius pinastri MD-312]
MSCSSLNNQEGQPPCVTAQEVGQLCQSSYVVSTTNFQESQYIPTSTTANECTCSWASYNLMSACALCSGEQQQQLASWSTWVANCGSNVPTSYLPIGYILPPGESIPFWAGTNASTWPNGIFDPTTALTKGGGGNYTQFVIDLFAKSHLSLVSPDLTGIPASSTTASSSSKTSVGAIVGGVVGGVAILCILVGFVFFVKCLRRRRASKQRIGVSDTTTINGAQFVTMPTTQGRSTSGIIQPVPFRYPQVPNNGPSTPLPMSPYLSSHGHSAASLHATSLASPTSPGFAAAPMSPPITDAADMISPFFATSPSSNRPQEGTLTGKAAEAQAERVLSPPGQQRARMNPPPYSPTSSPTPPSASRSPSRRLSLKQHFKRKGSESGNTTRSAGSTQSERRRLRAPRMASDGSVDSAASARSVSTEQGGSQGAMTILQGTNTSDNRPPAV